jgi:hypothetical protein
MRDVPQGAPSLVSRGAAAVLREDWRRVIERWRGAPLGVPRQYSSHVVIVVMVVVMIVMVVVGMVVVVLLGEC